jgi:hypothetical protein
MTLSLRRFEIVAVFVVALICSYFVASRFLSILPMDSTVYLIPQPAVMNEKEALLRSLQSADAKAIPEDHKAEVLHAVSAPTSAKSQQISADEKLKVLQQLSAQH